jgi:signal peptidase I
MKMEQEMNNREALLQEKLQQMKNNEAALNTREATSQSVANESAMNAREMAQETDEGGRRKPIISKNVLLWIRDIGIALLIAIIVLQFIKPTIVQQSSMENTLHENDYIFLNKQAYTFGSFTRGDIIVFHSGLAREDGGTKNLIKRVIGLPGDTVEIKDGGVLLNGKPLKESYTKDGFTAGAMEAVTVPDGKLFVMGDNRQNSEDSRMSPVGFVSAEQVVGKAFFRLYPLNKIGTLH